MGQTDALSPLNAANASPALAPNLGPLPLARPSTVHALSAGSGPVSGATPANSPAGKMHRVAKQFEGMFMTEMLRQAHPKSGATGAFRQGIGEQQMQPFMDQALGDAMAAHGGSGLTKIIERALNAAAAAKANAAGSK